MNESKEFGLLGRDLDELRELVEREGQPSYRAKQLFDGLYQQRVASLGEISTLPQAFRKVLQEKGFEAGLPSVENRFVSRDGTVRYLVGFSDAQTVEAVWMPEGDDGETGDGSDIGDELEKNGARKWNRATICVRSDQDGAGLRCMPRSTMAVGSPR